MSDFSRSNFTNKKISFFVLAIHLFSNVLIFSFIINAVVLLLVTEMLKRNENNIFQF